MRSSIFYATAVLASAVVAMLPERSPFLTPHFKPAFDTVLEKRQNNCPAGATSCSNLGNSGACCVSNTNCQLDQAGQVACCPIGAACTGTINVGGGFGVGSTQTPVTSSNQFIVPTSTTQGNLQFTASAGLSTVPNAFFPFVFAAATYSNAAACSSYYSSCQGEYNRCTVSLGGINGVTVSGAGVGITVAGSAPTAQAQSICSSLSSQACSGIQLAACNTFGTATTAGVTIINPNAAPTRCPGGLYGIGVGVAVGVAGQVFA